MIRGETFTPVLRTDDLGQAVRWVGEDTDVYAVLSLPDELSRADALT